MIKETGKVQYMTETEVETYIQTNGSRPRQRHDRFVAAVHLFADGKVDLQTVKREIDSYLASNPDGRTNIHPIIKTIIDSYKDASNEERLEEVNQLVNRKD